MSAVNQAVNAYQTRSPRDLTDYLGRHRQAPAVDTLGDQGLLTGNRPQARLMADGGIVVEGLVSFPEWLKQFAERLQALAGLPENWDSYGARRVDVASILATLNVLLVTMRDGVPAPSIVPTPRGGLQIEWHTRGIDLEIDTTDASQIRVSFFDQREPASSFDDCRVGTNFGIIADCLAKLAARA